MSLPDPLPIQPFTRPVRGAVTLPGSKSLTNRALLLAALCEGPVTLAGALFSEDTEIMAEALRRLGFSVREDAGSRSITVVGQGGRIPAEKAELFVGNAGTAARFLTALCAAAPRGVFTLDGVPRMRQRPMKGLIDALRSAGAEIRCLGQEGFFPLEIHPAGLAGLSRVRIDPSESSQLLSALLMIAPMAPAAVEIALAEQARAPFVEMTLAVMRGFGAVVERVGPGEFKVARGHPYSVRGPAVAGGSYGVEPDATAAGYFFALPLVAAGALEVRGLLPDSLIQGDLKFLEVLRRVGLSATRTPSGLAAGRDREPLRGVDQDFNGFSDTFLTLAAIAPLLEGPTRISGIAHTRKQETDRVAGMVRELKRLGQDVGETADALEIRPRPLPQADRPVEIETYRDHRFAMSFAILGCHDLRGDGRPWLAIRDPGCCAKTFPGFFEVLESLRQESLQAR